MSDDPTDESSSSDEESSDESSEESSEDSSSEESSEDASSEDDSSSEESSEDSSDSSDESSDESSSEEESSDDSSEDDSSSEEENSSEEESSEESSDDSSSDDSSSDESSDESSEDDGSSDESSDDSSDDSSSEDDSSEDEGSGDGLDDTAPNIALVARTNADLDHANALVVNMWLGLRFRDEADNPRPGLPYTLTIAGRTTEGKTNDQGMLLERMPLAEADGLLEIEDQKINLKLCQLPPIDQISGVQARLSNLHYYVGDNDNQLTQATQDALRRFQDDMASRGASLAVTGELDEATRAMLLEQHGS